MYRASTYGHYLLHSRVLWINRVRLPNLLVVSSTGKLSVSAERCIRGKYVYIMYWYSTAVCICLYTRYIFIRGHVHYLCTVHETRKVELLSHTEA